MHRAAENGRTAVLEFLFSDSGEKARYLEAGTNNGMRPLALAAGSGHVDTVQLLLQLGANPMMKDKVCLFVCAFCVCVCVYVSVCVCVCVSVSVSVSVSVCLCADFEAVHGFSHHHHPLATSAGIVCHASRLARPHCTLQLRVTTTKW